jgi:predicted GNAT family acetyltransferase
VFVTRYHTADAFLARAQAHLESDEAANNLIIGIAVRLKEFPERIVAQPYLATVEDDSGLLAAAMMTPPHRLLLHAESGDPEPLHLIAQDLIAGGWEVPGVNGPSHTSGEFAQIWTRLTGQTHRPGMHERVYELRQVFPPDPPVPGALRLATEEDLPWVSDWIWGFIQDAGVDGTADDAPAMAEQKISDRDLFIWEDGRPVSMVAKTRHTSHGIVVSLVYTPREHRNRGYASAGVAALSQRLLDAGWQFCALFTNLANPISNSIYQKIGYRPVVDFDEYYFG